MSMSRRMVPAAALIPALLIGCAHDDNSRQHATIVAPSRISSGDITQRPKSFQTTGAEEVAGNGADERHLRDQKMGDEYPKFKPRHEPSKDMYRRLWRQQVNARQQHDENRQRREAAETKSKTEESSPPRSQAGSARTKEKKRSEDEETHGKRENSLD